MRAAVARAYPADNPPLTLEEHLEVVQAGAKLAFHLADPMYVHEAVLRGATWDQIAEALDKPRHDAAATYVDWAERQHRRYGESGTGLNDEEYEAALERVDGVL
jgi:hypothetical protein